MGVNSAPPCTRSPGKVSDVSGRGKAASTRGTRYIALHPRHCARFSAMRMSEMLQSSARRADDRTRRWRMAVVTMRSRVRYGIAGGSSRNEHKILRLFRRTPISRFLYFELNVPNIFAILSALLRPPASLACVSSSHLLTRTSGSRRISHVTFRSLHLLHLFLRMVRSFQTLLHSRERSRLSYLASLLGEDLSCGTLAASRGMLVDLREVGRCPRGRSAA